jgi:signal peptidase I
MNLTQRLLGSWYNKPLVKTAFELIFIILPVAFLIRTFFFGLYQVPTGSMETTLLVGERFLANKLSYWFRKPQRGEIIAFDDPLYHYSNNTFHNLWQRYASFYVTNWTKRVIGVPGDRITGKIENGHPVIYLNNSKVPLHEPYVNKYPLIRVWKYKPEPSLTNDNSELRSFDPSISSWNAQPFYKIDPKKIIVDEDNNPYQVLYPDTPITKDIFDVVLKENQFWVMGDNRLNSGDSRMWNILDGKLIHGKIIYRIWSMDSDESWWILDLIKHPISFWTKVRWDRCFQFVS